MKQTLLVALLTTLSFNQLAASVRFVPANARLQDTLNVCFQGDTVILSDAVYGENLIIPDSGLTVASLYLFDRNDAHIFDCIIDGSQGTGDSTSCILIASEEPRTLTTLIGLTLTGGSGTYSPGLQARVGGAIYAQSHVNFRNCRVRNSQAGYGGGVFIEGIGLTERLSISLESCVVESCNAGNYGGGGWIKDCDLIAHEVSLIGNSTAAIGGALYIDRGTQNVTNIHVESNRGQAAGLYVSQGEGEIARSTFTGNGQTGNSLDCHLHCSGGRRLKVHSCIFQEGESGAIAVFLYGRGNDSIPDFFGNVLNSNHSFELTGTIAMITGYGRIHHNVIAGNRNINGGALYVADGAFLRADHNVFEANISDNPASGSVLLVNGPNTIRLDSNWIVGNSAVTMTCGPIDNCVNTVHAEYNWWGNESGPYHPALNPNGQGDTLDWDMAAFEPWLTVPPDTSLQSNVMAESPAVSSTWRLLTLYPNPFNNDFRMEIAGFTRDDFTVRLYDLLGREVAMLHTGHLTGGTIQFTAPAALSSGVYFVTARDRITAETKKVVLLK